MQCVFWKQNIIPWLLHYCTVLFLIVSYKSFLLSRQLKCGRTSSFSQRSLFLRCSFIAFVRPLRLLQCAYVVSTLITVKYSMLWYFLMLYWKEHNPTTPQHPNTPTPQPVPFILWFITNASFGYRLSPGVALLIYFDTNLWGQLYDIKINCRFTVKIGVALFKQRLLSLMFFKYNLKMTYTFNDHARNTYIQLMF